MNVIQHPSSRKLVVKRLLAEARAIKKLRREAKALRGHVVYPPEIRAKVIQLKQQRKENV
jgi:hypothetical protein